MFPKKNRLRKNNDFQSVFKQGKIISNELFFLKFKKNNLGFTRFGFIIGTKITNKATQRNKIKRRLREAAKKSLEKIKSNVDIIIIAKPEIINKSFQEIQQNINKLFEQIN